MPNKKYKNRSKNNKDLTKSLVTAGAIASVPSVSDKIKKLNRVSIDPNSKNLVIFSEGGRYNTGGSGHDAAAKAIAEAHKKKHPGSEVKIINYGEYSRARKLATRPAQATYQGMSKDYERFKKTKQVLNKIGFLPLLTSIQMSVDKRRMARDLKKLGPGRAIVTHPSTSRYAWGLGISPEVVVTDYDISSKGSRQFWDQSKKFFGTGPEKPISAVYAPSEESLKVFSDVGKRGVPLKQISSIPIEGKHLDKAKTFISSTSDKQGGVTREFDRFSPKKEKIGRISVPKKQKLVVVAGGGGGESVDRMMSALLKQKRSDVHFVAVAGKNQKVFDSLRKLELENPGRMSTTGFATNLEKLNEGAHVTVSRPHGLGPTEIGATGTPNINVVSKKRTVRAGGKKSKVKLVDNYAAHMALNAEIYKSKAGSPIAYLEHEEIFSEKRPKKSRLQVRKSRTTKKVKSSNSLNRQLTEVLENHQSYSNKARRFQRDLARGGGAVEVVSGGSRTVNLPFKGMPKKIKLPMYAAATLVAGTGVGKFMYNRKNLAKQRNKYVNKGKYFK
jgi:UDP-N-acetylglucosamine:LPS N-acetylglucosamine transferase